MAIQSTTSHSLTRFPSGSLRQLLVISFPLMLSLISSNLMLCWDRFLLASHSVEALTAAINGGCVAAAFQFGWISLTSIAEVFVGNSNGAGKLKEIGKPVWQMIWLSLLTALFFLPLALFAGPWLFQESTDVSSESNYFQWLMLFGPFFCLSSAVSAFFVGIGRVGTVLTTILGSNLLNMVLAWGLIFGIDPWIPSFGLSGAAIATGIAQTVQAILLLVAFLSKKNRATFGTGEWKFSSKEFWACFQMGYPNALAHSIEIVAWAFFYRIMDQMSPDHLIVAAVAQSIFSIFTFVSEGICKGACAIAANLIGAGEKGKLKKLFRSGIAFYGWVFVALGALFIAFPETIVSLFLPNIEPTSFLFSQVVASCFWVFVFILFDGISWLIVGLLTAAGDTGFILKVGPVSVWTFAILPAYVLFIWMDASPQVAWAITAFYGVINCAIYFSRLHSNSQKPVQIEAYAV